ncbi:MAG: CAP domain-containing protein [Planctomycetota bacterium]|jgi:uncharacterized protein YkwD|nr:CAP domain-containing protein [Planctomycetota bacterium]
MAMAKRGTKMVPLVAAALAALAGCSGTPGSRASSVKGVSARLLQDDSAAYEAYRLVNEERRIRGLPDLVRRPELDRVAARHARDQLWMGRLSHTGSDGSRLESRLSSLDWIWAGENLARNKGYGSPTREAVRGWIDSPRHRDNMFRPDFTHTGVASIRDPDTGFTYFVQIFIIPTA